MTKTRAGEFLRLAALWIALPVAPTLAQTTQTLFNFNYALGGAYPGAGVIRDAQGGLFGTTTQGGTANAGVIYKRTPQGEFTVLYNFTGGADGGSPSGLVRDSAGNLYGTSILQDTGTIFEFSAAGTFTVVYNFGQTGPGKPNGVIIDSAGNFYGSTIDGYVYELSTSGILTDLDYFGGETISTPVLDSSGNLYVATQSGGAYNAGAVFKLSPSGHETLLYTFTGGADGSGPIYVIRDSAGTLYGVTASGGTANLGVVFKLAGSQETVLHSFAGGADGAFPNMVVRDAAGNLYGTAAGGTANAGVVYQINAAGDESVLYAFAGGGGGNNPIGVVLGSTGDLYGATVSGGAGLGLIFKLDTTGQQTVLSTFPAPAKGSVPLASLARDATGNLYGTTSSGGSAVYGPNSELANMGVVFKLDTAGHVTVLHSFSGGADGGDPCSGVTLDPAGNLYGTALRGGDYNHGVLYQISPSGRETVLHSFAGGPDGNAPYAGVVRDSAGNLYGTTWSGGTSNGGTVYEFSVSGAFKVLYSFAGVDEGDGVNPYAGVTLDSSGNLYGTTWAGGSGGAGIIYKLSTSGEESVLYSFTGGADGCEPYAGVVLDTSGNLYGTTPACGALYDEQAFGVAYKWSSAGLTVLHTFSGTTDGGEPYGGLIIDSSGNLYGTTLFGGTATGIGSMGVVYMLDPAGDETVLHVFTGGSDGGEPYAGIIMDSAGNLYGTAEYGGTGGAGVVFELSQTGQLNRGAVP